MCPTPPVTTLTTWPNNLGSIPFPSRIAAGYYFIVLYEAMLNDAERLQLGKLGIFLGKNYLVTVHSESIRAVEMAERLWRSWTDLFYPVTIVTKGSQKDMLEDFIKNAHKRKPDLAAYVENAKVSLSVLEEAHQIQAGRLQTLTDETGGKIFLVADLADLAEEYAKVAHELRNTFSLAYYSKNTDRDGSMRKIRVEVRNPRYRVRSRTSYSVPKN